MHAGHSAAPQRAVTQGAAAQLGVKEVCNGGGLSHLDPDALVSWQRLRNRYARCPAVTRQAEHAGVARCLLNRGRGSQCLGPPAARSAAGPQSTLLAALSPGPYQCKVWTQVFSRVLQLEPAAGTHQDSPGLPRCADARPKATCCSRPPAIIERSWRSDRRAARSQHCPQANLMLPGLALMLLSSWHAGPLSLRARPCRAVRGSLRSFA